MFKKILFFAVLILNSSALIANNNANNGGANTNGGCGSSFTGNFNQIFQNAKNGNGVDYSGFNCSAVAGINADDKMLIADINFKTGEYACVSFKDLQENISENIEKNKETLPTLQKYYFTNLKCKVDSANLENQIKDGTAAIGKVTPATITVEINGKLANFQNNFIGFKQISQIADNAFSTKTFTTMDKIDYNTYKKNLSEIENLFKQKKPLTIPKIDTSSFVEQNQRNTISEVLTGVITLDNSYFDEQSAIDKNTGELKLKGNLNKTLVLKENTKDGFFSDGESVDEYDDNQFSKALNVASDLFDLKIWGYYLYFIENLRTWENSVILFFFTVGFFGLGGQKLIQAGYNYWGDQDSKTDLGFKKMMVSPMLMLITFVAPMVPSQMQLDKSLLNETSDNKVGIVLNGSANTATQEDSMMNSTIVQSAIRYFAHFGVISANKLADYSLYPYLKFLQYKAGLIQANALEPYKEFVKTSQKDVYVLQKEFEFYQNVCRKTYSNKFDNFNSIESPDIYSKVLPINNVSLSKTQTSFEQAKEVMKKNKINATGVTYDFCSLLANRIQKNSKTTVNNFMINNGTLYQFNETLKQTKGIELINRATEKSVNLQNKVGWIYSATIPLSYTLIIANDLSEDIKSRQDKIDTVLSIGDFKDDSVEVKSSSYKDSDNFFTSHSNQLMYFLLPGFNKLYEFLYNLGTETLKAIIAFIALFLTVFPGTTFVGISLFAMIITVAGKLALIYYAFLAAVFLYNVFLAIMSSTIIVLFIIYKIAMYFIELLLYFIASPVVVIWSVINNKASAIWSYIGRGAVLAITPVLIVLSCYVFLFCREIIFFIQLLVISVMKNSFITGEIVQTQQFILSSVVLIVTAFTNFVLIIVGYISIVKFPSWFIDAIGAKNNSLFDETINTLQNKTLALTKSPV